MVDQQRVELDRGASVTATRYRGGPSPLATLVLAHGAGASQASDFMVTFASGLAARGLNVVTFNFPFTERGKKLPDPQPVLEGCFRAVLTHAAGPALGTLPLFIGGKSLGGRIASHVAAARDVGDAATDAWWDRLRGLVFLGYPLHPPGKPQQVRVSHLPRVIHPMLVVQGAKDAFGAPAELRLFFDVLPAPSEIVVVEQGNHSLEVPKRSGLSQAEVFGAAQDRIAAWISECLEAARRGGSRPTP
ncbi:MAG: alpha/beta family hydrolase [Rhodospirillaceae bacterium]